MAHPQAGYDGTEGMEPGAADASGEPAVESEAAELIEEKVGWLTHPGAAVDAPCVRALLSRLAVSRQRCRQADAGIASTSCVHDRASWLRSSDIAPIYKHEHAIQVTRCRCHCRSGARSRWAAPSRRRVRWGTTQPRRRMRQRRGRARPQTRRSPPRTWQGPQSPVPFCKVPARVL
jgi:hypothetical protein